MSAQVTLSSYRLISQPVEFAFSVDSLAGFSSSILVSHWFSAVTDSLKGERPDAQAAPKPRPADFFGSAPVPFSAGPTQRRWDHVRASLDGYRQIQCAGAGNCAQRARLLETLVATERTADLPTKLEGVNATVNAMIRYRADRSVNGVTDNWADPADTVRSGAGDCEDYAILKLALLRELGVPMHSMSIVILRDRSRNMYHAVLAVTTNHGHLILDNMRNRVVRDTAISDYQPLYSFSADRSWIHGQKVHTRLASLKSAGGNEGAAAQPGIDRSIKTSSVGRNPWRDLRPVPVE